MSHGIADYWPSSTPPDTLFGVLLGRPANLLIGSMRVALFLLPAIAVGAKFDVYENADACQGQDSWTPLGALADADACAAACVAALGDDPTAGCTAWTWYHADYYKADLAGRCFGDASGAWSPFYSSLDAPQIYGNVTSAQNEPTAYRSACATAADCSHNGACGASTGVCECYPQWMGKYCGQLNLVEVRSPLVPTRRSHHNQDLVSRPLHSHMSRCRARDRRGRGLALDQRRRARELVGRLGRARRRRQVPHVRGRDDQQLRHRRLDVQLAHPPRRRRQRDGAVRAERCDVGRLGPRADCRARADGRVRRLFHRLVRRDPVLRRAGASRAALAQPTITPPVARHVGATITPPVRAPRWHKSRLPSRAQRLPCGVCER